MLQPRSSKECVNEIMMSTVSLRQLKNQQERQIFLDAETYPEFLHNNLNDPARAIKVFIKDPQANIRAFYYQYLKLCFEIDHPGYQNFIQKIEKLLVNQQFKFIIPQQWGVNLSNIQCKRIILQLFDILNNGQMSVDEALRKYSIIDTVFVLYFRSILIYAGKIFDVEKIIDKKELFEFLLTYFDIQATLYNNCLKFTDTDIFIYEESIDEIYMVYIDYNKKNNCENQCEEQLLSGSSFNYSNSQVNNHQRRTQERKSKFYSRNSVPYDSEIGTFIDFTQQQTYVDVLRDAKQLNKNNEPIKSSFAQRINKQGDKQNVFKNLDTLISQKKSKFSENYSKLTKEDEKIQNTCSVKSKSNTLLTEDKSLKLVSNLKCLGVNKEYQPFTCIQNQVRSQFYQSLPVPTYARADPPLNNYNFYRSYDQYTSQFFIQKLLQKPTGYEYKKAINFQEHNSTGIYHQNSSSISAQNSNYVKSFQNRYSIKQSNPLSLNNHTNSDFPNYSQSMGTSSLIMKTQFQSRNYEDCGTYKKQFNQQMITGSMLFKQNQCQTRFFEEKQEIKNTNQAWNKNPLFKLFQATPSVSPQIKNQEKTSKIKQKQDQIKLEYPKNEQQNLKQNRLYQDENIINKENYNTQQVKYIKNSEKTAFINFQTKNNFLQQVSTKEDFKDLFYAPKFDTFNIPSIKCNNQGKLFYIPNVTLQFSNSMVLNVLSEPFKSNLQNLRAKSRAQRTSTLYRMNL